MAKDNSTLTEPLTLTRCGLWRMHKSNLLAWATGRCLLEHETEVPVEEMTKDQLVDEIMGVLLYIEVHEDRRALATDTVSRPLAEVVG